MIQYKNKDNKSKKDFKKNVKKYKTVGEDALNRSIYNNMVVKKMDFQSPSGKYCSVIGKQLLLYTLTPGRPLIDCQYILPKMTKGVLGNREQEYTLRLCMYNKKQEENPDVCDISDDKIATHRCVGKKSKMGAMEFWIVTNGNITVDGDTQQFKIGFFNKIQNEYFNPEFLENPDKNKAKNLFELYNDIRSGKVLTESIPKPGNILFHTLFSGIVDVDIETITQDKLKGTIKGYDNPTGGIPLLFMNEGLRPIPLYTIGTMIINNYLISDLMRRRTLEIIMRGHIALPHPDGHLIFDYCKSRKLGRQQKIKLDGSIEPPIDLFDDHDKELLSIVREIN